MKIILTDDEIRTALVKTIAEKTNYINGEPELDDCYFVVFDENGDEIEQSVTVNYTWVLK